MIGAEAFAPTPRGMLCAQLYGGDMTAVVTGTYDGRPVWVRLDEKGRMRRRPLEPRRIPLPPAPKAEAGKPAGG